MGTLWHVNLMICAVLRCCLPAALQLLDNVLRAARNSTHHDVFYNVSRANSKAHCLPSCANMQHSVILQLGFQQCTCYVTSPCAQQAIQQRMFVQRAGSRYPSAAVLGMGLI